MQREVGGGVEKWKEGKQDDFLILKINTNYLLILKKKKNLSLLYSTSYSW